MQKGEFACKFRFYIHNDGILSCATLSVLDMDQVIENNFVYQTVNCLVHMKNALALHKFF